MTSCASHRCRACGGQGVIRPPGTEVLEYCVPPHGGWILSLVPLEEQAVSPSRVCREGALPLETTQTLHRDLVLPLKTRESFLLPALPSRTKTNKCIFLLSPVLTPEPDSPAKVPSSLHTLFSYTLSKTVRSGLRGSSPRPEAMNRCV